MFTMVNDVEGTNFTEHEPENTVHDVELKAPGLSALHATMPIAEEGEAVALQVVGEPLGTVVGEQLMERLVDVSESVKVAAAEFVPSVAFTV